MTSSFEISFIWKKFKIAAFSPFDFSDKIYIYRPGQPNLDFHSAYAFIKKSRFLPNEYETRSKLST